MEYLDIYDEIGNHIGKEQREIVHRDGLWHKTVHCWLYDKYGNIYFQIRKDEETLYTTASGHVLAGETIEEAFNREIIEEIGLNLKSEDLKEVETVIWKMDRENKDGSIFRDRAFANVYLSLFEGSVDDFNFDDREVLGVVKVNAKEILNIFEKEEGFIKGEVITHQEKEPNLVETRDISLNDFLVNSHETALSKYGKVLKTIIEIIEDK